MTITHAKRLVMAAAIAVMLAGLAVYAAGPLDLLCGLYTPNDPEWYVFFCYLR